MPPNDQSAKVLVVDDDTLMREVLKAILREDGFTVVGEARDGQAALSLVTRLNPDVVCLDVNMPGMSGLEVLKAMRRAAPDTKVVMITGDASMTTVREAVSFGAAGYIIKPFKAGRVGPAIRAALKGPDDSLFS
jgi:two-component system chemotaxis response regulator CheY